LKELTILTNKNLIAINQDSLGQQATCMVNCLADVNGYVSKQADNGGYLALLAVNWNDKLSRSLLIDFTLLGISSYTQCVITDLMNNEVIGTFKGSYYISQLNPHQSIALKMKCGVT
jgi:hypothetical protein